MPRRRNPRRECDARDSFNRLILSGPIVVGLQNFRRGALVTADGHSEREDSMRHHAAAFALAATAAAFCGCDVAAWGPESRQHVTETRRLHAQGTFTLENTNGAVVIETWTEPSVSIEAEKVGPEGELDQMRVEIRGEGDRVDVTTRHPRVTWGRHERVEYHVKVPAQARVE